jgi:CheY-like chemotaxis protein
VRILYVDDEPVNLRLLRDVFAVLLGQPDAVVTAEDPGEAVKLLGTEPFDIVISDQRMPGMVGTELLARASMLQPKAARLILTGYPGDPEVRAAEETGVAQAVVAKPWKAKDLGEVVRSLVARRQSSP